MLKRLILAGVVLLAGAVSLTEARLGAEILEQVLVKVNGDIITKSDFEQRQVVALQSRPEFAKISPNSPELPKAIAQITPDLIVDAVEEILLMQRGRELNYTLGDEQFKQIVENIKKTNDLTDEARFQAALKQEGLTLADLRRNLERQMLISQVQRVDVMEKISISEDESKAYYDAHRGDFTTPSEMTLREILVEVPTTDRGLNAAQDDEAKAQAEAIHARLTGGEPFARLAADLSASSSKANGGLIGPIKSNELAQPLQDLLDKMKVGDITAVIRTQRGYQILKLESRTETKIRTFEEAREDIADRVAETKRRAEMQKYLDRLRDQATITWRNDELKRAYEQALTRRRQEAAATPAA